MIIVNASKNSSINYIEPIEIPNDLERLRSILANKPRDLLLVDIISSTDIPVQELLRMKVKDFLHMKVGDQLPVEGNRAKKEYQLGITNVVNRTWLQYLKEYKPHEDDYIFKSRKGNKPLTLQGVSQMIKRYYEDAGLKGLRGIKSIRKAYALNASSDGGRSQKEPKDQAAVKILKPIETIGIGETVYRELLEAIVSGKIMPGQRLTAETIATQLNVSSMPVREAIGRLKEAGFVSVARKTGIVVNSLSKNMLREILEIRLALEGLAARKAALALTDNTLRRLESLYREYERAASLGIADEVLKINKVFHLTIYREAGMPFLEEMIEALWNKISPYFHILLRVLGEREHGLGQSTANFHKSIVEGLRHRDPSEVYKWLESDLTVPTEQVIIFFNKITKRTV